MEKKIRIVLSVLVIMTTAALLIETGSYVPMVLLLLLIGLFKESDSAALQKSPTWKDVALRATAVSMNFAAEVDRIKADLLKLNETARDLFAENVELKEVIAELKSREAKQ